MNTPDEFSLYHDDLLEGDYYCVDRRVLNAPLKPSDLPHKAQQRNNLLSLVIQLAPKDMMT